MTSENEKQSYTVREWREEDCEEIWNMIKELAIHADMLEQVHTTAEGLRRDGFGPKAFFKCFVAEDTTVPEENGRRPLIGYTLFFYKYSTWEGRCLYLEDLYVPEKQRKRGLGRALVRAVAQLAAREGCKRIDFSVLAWHRNSIKFYEHIGAVNITTTEEWNTFRFEEENIKRLADS